MAYRIASNTGTQKSHIAAKEETGETKLALSSNDFLFSQVTIVSSVMTELNSFLIKPETSKFVNANGDAWTNESLRANYSSFIGSYNFVNHVQVPEKSVGFLADAGLRRIILDSEKHIFVHYVDLLVATHRDFEDLVHKILTKQIQYLSMGCDMAFSTCSACGHTAYDDVNLCEHMISQKGKSFIDDRGVKRMTADLLGNETPGTVTFIESSWLTQVPAFSGAASRNILPVPKDSTVEISMPSAAAEKDAVQRFIGDK
jgi:hypothetical protein